MKIIAYYLLKGRTPTSQKKEVAAQRTVAEAYAQNIHGTINASFQESNADRDGNYPELLKALKRAKTQGAILVIPKFDSLSRSATVLNTILESGVEFFACDHTYANRAALPIMIAKAQSESIVRSRLTKDFLATAKANGVKLGSARPDHWKGREHLRGFAKGAENSAKVRSKRAAATYAFILPRIQEMHEQKVSYREIAEKLNAEGHQTTAGKPLTAVAVHRILKRYKPKKTAI